jgi:probable phosphoglycerate mutase
MKIAFCDGACRGGNPGFTSCAWVLYVDGADVQHRSTYLGNVRRTNNYAEYHGLLSLLEALFVNSVRNVIIYSDSKLVVNQVNQKWEVNSDDLHPLMSKAYGLLVQGCHVLKHCDGHSGIEGNEQADKLCNEVLDIHKEEYEKLAKVQLVGVSAQL